ncbi:DDE-type integrase/transposase/recombinase [Aquimarina algiphila]|uniref:DDE-type integrase/transposase/recombinase n=1 Tax=Aquimarina algiphila TaxID=2047982 RepID=UPI002492A297|nr:DDE-type integrase/transposase/recombinase [Aquimarina algiphila]
MENRLSDYNKGKSSYYAFHTSHSNNEKWLSYEYIPSKKKLQLNLPIDSEVFKKIINENNNNIDLNLRLKKIWLILSNAWQNPMSWKKYIPYYTEYYLDHEIRILFAKTHSLFVEVISMKQNSFKLTEIHVVYLKLENAVFRTENYKSFSRKIRVAEKDEISRALMHDFKKFGRNAYKLSNMTINRIKFYYSSKKRYPKNKITQLVNNELISRGLRPISYNTVVRVLSDKKLRNQCDMIRFGDKHTRTNILPYLRREDPKCLGELYQIDSTRLNIPYQDNSNNICYLNLCVMMDVFSRRIIGYSFSETENHVMILKCIQEALSSFKIIPKQIVHDNHKAYFSEEFRKLKTKLDDYGVHLRASKIGNPRDKGHVERWFRTFQTVYLINVMGFLGDGIKSKTEGARASNDLELYYKKKHLLRNRESLEKLISKLIKEYNTSKKNGKIKTELAEIRKFKPSDIAKLFFRTKRILVRRSMVSLTYKGNKLTYTIYNRHLADKINNTYVSVRFDREDLDRIYIFNTSPENYLGLLKVDIPISIIPTEEELVKLKKHNKKIKKRIHDTFQDLITDFDNGKIELESLPIQAFNNKSHLKEILNQAEDQLLIKELINKDSKFKPTECNTSIKKTKNSYANYLSKVKSKKFKVIE